MSLKPINNPIILENADYIELFGIPEDQLNNLASQERLKKWIKQATDQFDSLISGNNDAGSLYRWWKNLEDNEEDNQKGFKLQKAIGSWVETYIQTGKFWTDGAPDINSNMNVALNASSDNSSVETKRMDIIQDLVSIGLYRTSNMELSNQNQMTSQEQEQLVLVSLQYLEDNFLRINPQLKGMQGNLSGNGKELYQFGDITGLQTSPNKPKLSNYQLINADVIGANLGDEVKAKYVYDPNDLIYKIIDAFPISTWKGLTAQEIFALVQEVLENSGIAWKEDQTYAIDQKTFIPLYEQGELFKLQYYLSKINDNLGNNPETSLFAWNPIPDAEIPIGEIIEALKPYVDIAVEEAVDKLPSITVGTGLEITAEEVLQVDSTILTEAEAIAKFVDLLTNQVIAGVKTINQTIQETITFKQNLRLFHDNNTAGYVDFVQKYEGSGYKNWTGFRFFRKENGTDVQVAEIVMDADNNLRFNSTGDGFIFNSKRLMEVGDATADTDAPNFKQLKLKQDITAADAKYATKTDLGTKQNTLIAGDNITITGDTISATGGTSIDYEIVQETFLTDGSGYIRDIIQVNQVISVGDSQGEKFILWNFLDATWLLVYFWDTELKIWNNFENKSVNIWLKKPIVKKEGQNE